MDENDSDFSDDLDYVDSRSFSSSIDLYENDNEDDETEYIRNIYPKYPQCWINDNIVDNCYNCLEVFSIFNRKHHCRSCGRIFCNKCSNFFIELPHNYIKFPKQHTNYIKKIKKNIIDDKKERVCLYCYDKINNLNKLFKYMLVFELLAFDIKQLKFISLVSKKWNYASNTILMKLREIQYYPIGQKLMDIEKKILWANRKYYSGHSIWLCMLIKSINWSNKTVSNELLKIIFEPKTYHCCHLMCTHQCHTGFSISDIIDLISNIIPNKELNNYLINRLDVLDNKELIVYIPLLIYYMRYECNDNKYISNLVINKIINCRDILNIVYWLLVINCEIKHNYVKYTDILCDLNNKIAELNQNDINEINLSFKLIHILNNIPKNSTKTNIIEYLKYMVRNHKLFNSNIDLYIPLNENYKCIDIVYDNIEIKNSATAPIKIPLLCIKNNKTVYYNIIFKNEDIRVDMVIMNVINMIDIILKRDENLDLNIKKYNILPTSPDSGIIQIVDNAETLYNISQNHKMSILNYIIEHNPTSKVEDIRNIFIKSSAAYCVITYILGIGDRHLDNIMVTERGELFHIDYSFILGKEPPKMLSVPKIRITPEMLDAMGGENSIGFDRFKKLVSRIYKCLRSHYNLFINMLIILADISDKYDKENIRDEIINRFLLGQSHIEAELDIVTHISNSKSNHYSHNIIDFFHHHQKEQTINKIINKTNNITNNLYNMIWG